MVQSYIRRRATSGSNGRQLNINIENIKRTKGTPPNRINIPGLSAENQISVPVLGQQDGFDIVIRLKIEDSNIAFDVTAAGSTSAHSPNVTAIVDAYNFLYDEVVSNEITSNYELFLERYNVTFRGTLLVDDQQNNSASYGQELIIILRIDRGKNFIHDAVAN